MSNRPYKMSYVPPIVGEIKNGEKGDRKPVKFPYWKIVLRQRVANKNNWNPHKEAMDFLGEKPTRVGIRLLADDVADVMPTTRMLYDVGRHAPRCSAPYHATRDNTRAYKADPRNGKPLRQNEYNPDNGQINGTGGKVVVEDMNFIVASRFQNGDYVDFPCNPHCPLLQLEKGACKPQSIMFFRLAPEVAFGINGIFAYRATGIWAQKSLSSSLEAIRAQTGGILANLPLVLRYHEEVKNTPFGRNAIPFPMIEPGLDHDAFMEKVAEEHARRAVTHRRTDGKIVDMTFRQMVERGDLVEEDLEVHEEDKSSELFGD